MPENPERWRIYVDDGNAFVPEDEVMIAHSAKEALDKWLFTHTDLMESNRRFAVLNLNDVGELFILKLVVPKRLDLVQI